MYFSLHFPHHYSEERVRKGADKLVKMVSAKQQGRLDGFFKVVPTDGKPKAGAAKGKDAGKAGAKGGKGVKRKVNISFTFYLFFSWTMDNTLTFGRDAGYVRRMIRKMLAVAAKKQRWERNDCSILFLPVCCDIFH